jgi:N12 class adenine-specific DNA methylase
LRIADTTNQAVTSAILREALKDDTLGEPERERVAGLLAESESGKPFIDQKSNDELPIPAAAERLAYDGMQIWGNDDVAAPTSVFAWSTYRITQLPDPRNRHNFHLNDESAETIGVGGDKFKVSHNLDAIQLLKTLDEEQRNATQEEQTILANYVDFGGLRTMWDQRWNFRNEHTRMESILSEEEIEAIKETSLNTHYTSIPVVDEVWKAANRLGFQGGTVLEPGMGIGNFFGRMPVQLAEKSDLIGIEKNIISGRMAQALYPDAKIIVQPYEQVQLPNNSVDLFIGNPPFADIKITDPLYKTPKLSVHNYFLVKSLDKLKPGAVAAVITSHYTLDSQNPRAREEMFARADLVGAVRLPDTAFKENAGTRVTADILFFRKRLPEEEAEATPYSNHWLNSSSIAIDHEDGEQSARVNQYFQEHPEMVLGEHSVDHSQYGAFQYTLKANGDLREQLAAAVQTLPENVAVYEDKAAARKAGKSNISPSLALAPTNIKENAFFVEDGKVWIKQKGAREPLPPSLNTPARIRQLKLLISVRDALKDTIRVQLDSADDNALQASQNVLTRRYNHYVETYGPLTGPKTERVFEDDPEYPLLTALENVDPETHEIFCADIFTKRTSRPYEPLRELPDDPKAAMLKVMAHTGRLDTNLMAELLDQDEATVIGSLIQNNLIFRDPVSGEYATSDAYLSGNVREKLAQAESATAFDPNFQRNVEALAAVQPEPISIVDIEFRLGQTWIPTTYYADFVHTELAGRRYGDKPTVARDHEGKWNVKLPRSYNDFALEHQAAGGGISGHKLAEYALNLQQPTVYFPADSDGKRAVDTVNTVAARVKLQEIKDQFSEWIKGDKQSSNHPELERIYNTVFNSNRLREYNGSHLQFPGLNPRYTPRHYQAASVWRIMQEGRSLTDHFVGSGKTLTMMCAGMECRRTGISNKNMYVVPNNMVPQWREDFKKAYPSANVLAVTDRDFQSAKHRQRLFARVATNDWDAVIIPQSQFDLLPISPEREAITIRKQRNELRDLLRDSTEGGDSDKRTLRQMQNTLQKQEQRLKELAGGRKDNAIYFDDLGVDMLFVDEAHKYKALSIATKMKNIAGLSTRRSQRAQNILAKIEYMYDTHNGRGVVFATGTSITNTLGEAYVMTRYLAPDLLEQAGIRNFDDWAANFAEAVTRMEYATDGMTIRPKTALAAFVNVPELQQMWSQFADVMTQGAAVQAGYIKIPQVQRRDVLVKVTPEQEPMLREIAERGERLMLPMSDPDHPDPTVDNWLKLDSDARDISLDARFYDSYATDHPDSKATAVAKITIDVLKRTEDQRGTVVIFADRYATSDGKFNLFEDVKAKLVAQGTPANEIAIVHDYPKREEFYALQQSMNAGRIRVALGTTEKFGIGVNVQERLKAEIHLDLPQRPDQVEQREGRIARNGNTFEEVEIYRVISEPRDVNSPKAHDLQRAQLLERKQTFLTQFRSGNRLGRRIEDAAGDVRLSPQLFALAKAQATGNPLAMEKIKLEHELRQVALLDRSHQLTHHHNRQELDRAEMEHAYLNTRLPKLEDILERFQKHEQRDEHGNLVSLKVVFNDHAFSKIKDANEYLKEHPALSDTTRLQVNGIDIPVGLENQIVGQGDGLFKRMMVVQYKFVDKWHDAPRVDGTGLSTSQSLLASVLSRSRDLETNIAHTKQEIIETEELMKNLQAEVEKKSPYADKLAQYEARLEEVQAELMKNVKEVNELGEVQAQEEGEERDEDAEEARESAKTAPAATPQHAVPVNPARELSPDTEILHCIENKEDGTAGEVARNRTTGKFSVVLRDTEADKTLPAAWRFDTEKEAVAKAYELVNLPAPQERIAVNMTKQHSELCIADEHPGEPTAQATALYTMVVKGEAVTIMNGSVDLRYDQKTEQLYASLNPDDKPALQRHVKRLLEAQAGHRQVPQGQGREDVERE